MGNSGTQAGTEAILIRNNLDGAQFGHAVPRHIIGHSPLGCHADHRHTHAKMRDSSDRRGAGAMGKIGPRARWLCHWVRGGVTKGSEPLR